MPQSTSGHNSTAPHVGPNAHNLTVQSQGPEVVQGQVHPPAPITSAQGQQQFQRLKVLLQTNKPKLYSPKGTKTQLSGSNVLRYRNNNKKIQSQPPFFTLFASDWRYVK